MIGIEFLKDVIQQTIDFLSYERIIVLKPKKPDRTSPSEPIKQKQTKQMKQAANMTIDTKFNFYSDAGGKA